MTVYSATDGLAVGYPINPNFGAANGAAAAPTITQPTQAPVTGGMQATGVQMSILEACSRGIIPRNAIVGSVGGANVNPGGGSGGQGGNGPSIDQMLGCGDSADANTTGCATPGSAGVPSTSAAVGVLNTQVFSDGISVNSAALATGPTSDNTSSLTQSTMPGAVTTANVGLQSNSFAG